ncbi:hypothetical protein [Aquimarina brevivitae]|nr:hypothetical protein [Aquimarina brevivitae]
MRKLKKSAKNDAEVFTQATIQRDYNLILKHSHPKIVNAFGKDEMISSMEDTYRTMSAQKISILESEIEEVSDIQEENNEYRSLIKTTTLMDYNGRKVTLKSSLFGFYDQENEIWYFIESNKLLNDTDTQSLFPNFKTAISIPADEQIAEDS